MVADTPDWNTPSIVSSGNIDVTAGDITIQDGQNGVNVSIDTPPKSVGTVSMPAFSTTTNANFSLDTNATGVRVMLKAGGSSSMSGIQPRVTIKGGVSGQILADVEVPFSDFLTSRDGVLVIAALSGADETSVNVAVTWNNIGGGSPVAVASVFELLATGVQQVYATPRQPLPVNSLLPINDLQVENVQSAEISFGVASNSSANILAGMAHEQYLIVGLEMSVSPSSGASTGFGVWFMEDTTGAVGVTGGQILIGTAVGKLSSEVTMSGQKYIALPVAAGLRIRTPVNNYTLNFQGVVRYVLV